MCVVGKKLFKNNGECVATFDTHWHAVQSMLRDWTENEVYRDAPLGVVMSDTVEKNNAGKSYVGFIDMAENTTEKKPTCRESPHVENIDTVEKSNM